MRDISLNSINLLSKKILFIDGLSRSGKSMIGPVLGSFNKTYPMQHQNLMDNLFQLLQINQVSKNVCKSLINIFLNENIYYLNLSRGVNFRPEDNSSVLKDKNYKLFIKNLTKKEGDQVIKQIKRDKNLPIFQSHDLLSVVDLLEITIPDFRMIHILRNPIDNIFSFYSKYNQRYKGKKYDIDNPRFFSLAFKSKNKLVPYYALKNPDYFLKLNNLEKVTFYYLKILEKSQKKYLNFKNKNKIKIIRFDDFIQKPYQVIKKLENFLKLKKSSYTKISCKIEKVPRKIDNGSRERKFRFIKKSINKKMFERLNKKIILYEKNKLF
tara:strand:+ start:439 stop:1410 length:972 start_codon:yes stop_codon:yes gene_type:complete